MTIEHKAAPTQTLTTDLGEGIVTAIVSVTGVEDEVGDIIVPGAYANTLKTRIPKGVFSHSWEKPVAKTLEAVELMPGDPGLPTHTATGEPWPEAAGAAVVKMQYNLNTEAGRDAYENVRFYGAEQQWSIGFNVPKGKSRFDGKKGIRYIDALDWFEYSTVLFGAMPLTSTLSVKGHNTDTVTETKIIPGSFEELVHEIQEAADAQFPDADAVVITATFPDRVVLAVCEGADVQAFQLDYTQGPDGVTLDNPTPVKIVQSIEPDPDGTPVVDVTPDQAAADTGPTPAPDQAAPDQGNAAAPMSEADVTIKTEDDDTETKMDPEPEAKAGGLDRNRGGAEKLRHYWVHGPGAAKIQWGVPGDFDRCVTELTKYLGARAKGYCFSGDTAFLTRDGERTFAETVGTRQLVLTQAPPTGKRSQPHRRDGYWVEAEIHAFGEQPLRTVTLTRNGQTKVIRATPEHRWFASPNGRNVRRFDVDVLTTDDLRPGMALTALSPKVVVDRSTPSPFGIAAGIVYGDGCAGVNGAEIDLWGDKDADLLRYFEGCPMGVCKKESTGLLGTRVRGLPASWKSLPALTEGIGYLYGWLAGYIAADGSVSKQGAVELFSADRAALEHARTVATRLGIETMSILTYARKGIDGTVSDLHRLRFLAASVPEDLLILPEHRARFTAAGQTQQPIRWKVVSVEDHGEVEPVYCAVVPATETFVLTDGLWVSNCQLRHKEALGVYAGQEHPKSLDQLVGKALDEVMEYADHPDTDAEEAKAWEAIDAETKRSFSARQRARAASSGAALPDGSFPILNRTDLDNAIQSLGRAKDKAKAKAHIIARARALDAVYMLPTDWGIKKDADAPGETTDLPEAPEVKALLDGVDMLTPDEIAAMAALRESDA